MFNDMLATLLQLSFFALAAASPINTQMESNPTGYHIGGGIAGFIVLVLDIIVWSKFVRGLRGP